MEQTDEIGVRMVVGKTVKATEFEANGVGRVVLTFTDNSQLMIYGEGLGFTFRQQNAEPLMTIDVLRQMFRHNE